MSFCSYRRNFRHQSMCDAYIECFGFSIAAIGDAMRSLQIAKEKTHGKIQLLAKIVAE